MASHDPSIDQRERAKPVDYLRIARLDHMTKHVFIIPGILLAILLRGMTETMGGLFFNVTVGFISAVCVASANYVINEYLDREFDIFHPEKSQRAAVQREMSGQIVFVEWAVLLVVGLILAAQINVIFLIAAALLAISGITYNVQPLRTKDRIYLDVISESVNNPIRLLLGWTMVDGGSLPPVSIIIGFWFGGAFLMNSKRLAEYRDIVASNGAVTLGLYRRSFRFYTEKSLSVANLVYALLCSFALAIFLVKYRIEYIIVIPFIVMLFSAYYSLALTPDSVARKPEKLYRSTSLIGYSALAVLLFALATFVNMPFLETLTNQHFIDVSGLSLDQ